MRTRVGGNAKLNKFFYCHVKSVFIGEVDADGYIEDGQSSELSVRSGAEHTHSVFLSGDDGFGLLLDGVESVGYMPTVFGCE